MAQALRQYVRQDKGAQHFEKHFTLKEIQSTHDMTLPPFVPSKTDCGRGVGCYSQIMRIFFINNCTQIYTLHGPHKYGG